MTYGFYTHSVTTLYITSCNQVVFGDSEDHRASDLFTPSSLNPHCTEPQAVVHNMNQINMLLYYFRRDSMKIPTPSGQTNLERLWRISLEWMAQRGRESARAGARLERALLKYFVM